jgi:hypothetical protein
MSNYYVCLLARRTTDALSMLIEMNEYRHVSGHSCLWYGDCTIKKMQEIKVKNYRLSEKNEIKA